MQNKKEALLSRKLSGIVQIEYDETWLNAGHVLAGMMWHDLHNSNGRKAGSFVSRCGACGCLNIRLRTKGQSLIESDKQH